MNGKTVILLLAVAMVGCATDVANRYYSDVQYPARSVDEVAVFTNAPTRPYIVIADFQARGETPRDMRNQAAKIGADAVIVTYLGGLYDSHDQWAGHDSQNHTYAHIVGTALKYTP